MADPTPRETIQWAISALTMINDVEKSPRDLTIFLLDGLEITEDREPTPVEMTLLNRITILLILAYRGFEAAADVMGIPTDELWRRYTLGVARKMLEEEW